MKNVNQIGKCSTKPGKTGRKRLTESQLKGGMAGAFNICIVAQAGRLSYEAVLFAASLRASAPGFQGKLIVGEPCAGPLWPRDPRIDPEARKALQDLGATLVPFETLHFGARYPYANKIEMLAALPADEPFVFFDTDTLITGPVDQIAFDFDRPSASMRRENTWPEVPLYGPSLSDIWQAVYDRACVDMAPSLDQSEPEGYWQRHLYFNAGWFYFRCPQVFATRMLDLMVSLDSDRPPELACQSLNPWLDQVALPAVITGLGGGRPGPELDGLDGDISLHWRALPLLFAKAPEHTLAFLSELTAPNKIKKVLKLYEPFKRLIYQNKGEKIRALFGQDAPILPERKLRNRIKREKLWMR